MSDRPRGGDLAALTTEPATVYRAAGRRWLTLKGAARAAAKKRVKERWAEDYPDMPIERRARIVSKLAYKYERSLSLKDTAS